MSPWWRGEDVVDPGCDGGCAGRVFLFGVVAAKVVEDVCFAHLDLSGRNVDFVWESRLFVGQVRPNCAETELAKQIEGQWERVGEAGGGGT
jgi:hypothetical protein